MLFGLLRTLRALPDVSKTPTALSRTRRTFTDGAAPTLMSRTFTEARIMLQTLRQRCKRRSNAANDAITPRTSQTSHEHHRSSSMPILRPSQVTSDLRYYGKKLVRGRTYQKPTAHTRTFWKALVRLGKAKWKLGDYTRMLRKLADHARAFSKRL